MKESVSMVYNLREWEKKKYFFSEEILDNKFYKAIWLLHGHLEVLAVACQQKRDNENKERKNTGSLNDYIFFFPL